MRQLPAKCDSSSVTVCIGVCVHNLVCVCVCVFVGCVHGLADSVGQRCADSGPRVRVSGVHTAGPSLGLQPHLRHRAGGHLAAGRHVQAPHRLLRPTRQDRGVKGRERMDEVRDGWTCGMNGLVGWTDRDFLTF